MIHEDLSDFVIGQSASVDQTELVRTGREATQAKLSHASNLEPIQIYNTLSGTVESISLSMPFPIFTKII